MTDLWSYHPDLDVPTLDITGYSVEAEDGHIGKIDAASADVGEAFIVVDTGFWIFGKKRVIPARAIKQVDTAEEKVFIRLTKDQVKDAPDLDVDMADRWRPEPARRDPHDEYYGPFLF